MRTTPKQFTEADAAASSELKLVYHWQSEEIRRLIQRKTKSGRRPSYLFLGRHEADLLRDHLGAAFGPESVRTLKNLYYMGLQVVELDIESYLRTAGSKRVDALTEALNHRPSWKDLEASSFWSFLLR